MGNYNKKGVKSRFKKGIPQMSLYSGIYAIFMGDNDYRLCLNQNKDSKIKMLFGPDDQIFPPQSYDAFTTGKRKSSGSKLRTLL